MLKLTLLIVMLLGQVHASMLNRGNGGEPDSLHPHLAQGLNSHNILYDLYEGLYRYDAQGQAVLGAASDVLVSDDGLTWTFTIGPHRWSNGDAVTADHFLQAWQQASDPITAAPYGQLFDNLRGPDGLQSHINAAGQLVVRLNQANPRFADQLVLPVFMPQHPDSQVYNGAYQLVSRQLQEHITLKKNPHHPDAEAIHFEQVRYWVTENQNSELNRFMTGELDITETIPDAKIDALRASHPQALRVSPYFGTFFLGLDLRDRHLSNLALRQALSLAIDRDILVEKVLKSGQTMANGLVPKAGGDSGLDLKRAQSLLLQSGFDHKTEKLTLLYNSSQNQKKVALAVAAMWRQNLGVQTRLQNQEWKVFVSSRKKAGKQVFRGGWIADYHDPMNFLQLFHSNSHFNYYGFVSSQYDALLNAWPQAGPKAQVKLLQQAEAILAEQVPMIPLYHYVSRHMVNPEIQGFEDNLLDKHLSRYLSQ